MASGLEIQRFDFKLKLQEYLIAWFQSIGGCKSYSGKGDE
jgi:hypothetical protein